MRIVTSLPYTEEPVAEGNFDRSRSTIDRIVIHTMVASADSAAARFNDPTQKVSAHYGVKLDGTIIHWLEETFTAYHAGDYPMNQRSIGIEHEDNGDFNGTRPDSLYNTSGALVRDICLYYGLPIDRTHVIKHSEVIATGCPDALDIDRIVRIAQQNPSGTATNTALSECLAQHTKLVDLCNQKDATIAELTKEIESLKEQLASQPAPAPEAPQAPQPSVPSQPAYPDLSKDLMACQMDVKTIGTRVQNQQAILQRIKQISYGKAWPWDKTTQIKAVLSQAGI